MIISPGCGEHWRRHKECLCVCMCVCVCVCSLWDSNREREAHRETETETETEIETETDRQTDRQADRESHPNPGLWTCSCSVRPIITFINVKTSAADPDNVKAAAPASSLPPQPPPSCHDITAHDTGLIMDSGRGLASGQWQDMSSGHQVPTSWRCPLEGGGACFHATGTAAIPPGWPLQVASY